MDRKKQSPPDEPRSILYSLSHDPSPASEPPVPNVPLHTFPRNELQPPTFISAKLKSNDEKETKRDSDLATLTTRNSRTSLCTDGQRASSLTSIPSVPQILLENDSLPSQGDETTASRPLSSSSNKSGRIKKTRLSAAPTEDFHGLTLEIPSGDISGLMPMGTVEFSKRGSMLIDGKKANTAGQPEQAGLSLEASEKMPRSPPSVRNAPEALSPEEEMLSQRVRSFYEAGLDLEHGSICSSSFGLKIDSNWQRTLEGLGGSGMPCVSRATSTSDVRSIHSAARSAQHWRESLLQREENELAGGLEDWQDIDSADVDRYGFIIVKNPSLSSFAETGVKRSDTMRDPASLQRIATSLHLASESPRQRGSIKRTLSSARNVTPTSDSSKVSRKKPLQRPTSSQSGYHEPVANLSKIRSATNQLPHNKNRKLLDEAGDMLTLPSSLENVPENGQSRGSQNPSKRKETEREEKWRKMARVVSNDPAGSGMVFVFDTQNAKLVERTWKGIPDRWRATAWHAFLSASAKKRPGSLSDDELREAFYEYLSQSSPDDVQIDIDVPRTISSHIMFRRRYRGGQRLLFRVLHAMSLHSPETGYVQGMAVIAATLLAYYEEERAFVMLVRLWELRGLGRLYQAGFGGLMEALDDFEKRWLGAGELAAKLDGLGITPTAYGTRWYLTLFNYSIPFPAQLRVWDVFMLLEDDHDMSTRVRAEDTPPFGTTLDVLHATSAALIDGMRDILLGSDFENAMKTLTSWIPIQDEDLFMRVAKTEWKVHKRKA